MITQKQSVK